VIAIPRPADSGVRAIALPARIRELAAAMAAVGAVAPGDEAAERAHLAAYGAHGRAVVAVAAEQGVPLRLVLGPGAPAPAARAARRAAVEVLLLEAGLSAGDCARVLRLSEQAVRDHRAAFARKAAA
jgi:hypothetical protein